MRMLEVEKMTDKVGRILETYETGGARKSHRRSVRELTYAVNEYGRFFDMLISEQGGHYDMGWVG